MDAHLSALQRDLLIKLAQCKSLGDFYLAGGTALNLQLGHRVSVDLDFFSEKEVNPEKVMEELGRGLTTEGAQIEPGTLHVKVEGIPVSFLEYHYKVLQKIDYHGIRMASLKDIGLMKIMAIQQRGLRKDFIDLFAICRTGISLSELVGLMNVKYPSMKIDSISPLKALCYFRDAVDDVSLLTRDIEWESVKKFFQSEVKKLLLTQ